MKNPFSSCNLQTRSSSSVLNGTANISLPFKFSSYCKTKTGNRIVNHFDGVLILKRRSPLLNKHPNCFFFFLMSCRTVFSRPFRHKCLAQCKLNIKWHIFSIHDISVRLQKSQNAILLVLTIRFVRITVALQNACVQMVLLVKTVA